MIAEGKIGHFKPVNIYFGSSLEWRCSKIVISDLNSFILVVVFRKGVGWGKIGHLKSCSLWWYRGVGESKIAISHPNFTAFYCHPPPPQN